jgi:hypothetical protein
MGPASEKGSMGARRPGRHAPAWLDSRVGHRTSAQRRNLASRVHQAHVYHCKQATLCGKVPMHCNLLILLAGKFT